MYDLKIIRNYADSLFANLQSKAEHKSVLQELIDISQLLKTNLEIFNLLCSPIVPVAIKQHGISLINKQLKSSRIVRNFCILLVQKRRFCIIHDISEYFVEIYHKANDIKRVQITSVNKLSDKELNKVKSFFVKYIGTKIELQNNTDAALLGGVVVRYDSMLIDCSIANVLQKVENRAMHMDLAQ